MALLAKGKWPLLQSTSLYHTANLDAVTVAHLSSANWPLLHSLNSSDVIFKAAMFGELAHL